MLKILWKRFIRLFKKRIETITSLPMDKSSFDWGFPIREGSTSWGELAGFKNVGNFAISSRQSP